MTRPAFTSVLCQKRGRTRHATCLHFCGQDFTALDEALLIRPGAMLCKTTQRSSGFFSALVEHPDSNHLLLLADNSLPTILMHDIKPENTTITDVKAPPDFLDQLDDHKHRF